MVEEKGLLQKEIQIEHEGIVHYMTVENVIEAIEVAPSHEKRIIKDTFSRIDFANGDLMHYIKHLAKGLVVNNF